MSRFILAAALTVLVVALVPGVASAANRKSSSSVAVASHTVVGPGAGFGHATGAPRVRLIQRKLRAEGFSPGRIDGLYGPLTTAAVARFQQSRRLVADGIVGPVTSKALNGGGESPGAGVLQAHGSQAVRTLQRRLKRAGFAPGSVDGRYGPRTTNAVMRFQRARRLPTDGIAGPRTLHVLGAGQSGAPTKSRPKSNQPTTRGRPTTGTGHSSSPKPKQHSASVRHQAAAGGSNPVRSSKPPSRNHSDFQLIATLILAAIGIGLLVTLLVRPRRQRRRPRGEPTAPSTSYEEQRGPTTPAEPLPQQRGPTTPAEPLPQRRE
jgi:peptidoglycan hydrolase-like protein with peptidoglycan-binding domain